MFNNRNKSANYGDIQAGETLFDFLKRKKKFALEASLSQSRKKDISKQNINTNSNMKAKQSNNKNNQSTLSPHKRYEDTYKETVKDNRMNISIGKSNQETYRSMINSNLNATTPKRVSFVEDKEKKPTPRSSFIQMISPLKRRNSKTPDQYMPECQKNKSNPQQHFYRKNLNNAMGQLKTTMQQFMTMSTTIKQKSHTLFVELKPLLKIVEESSNANFARRAEDVKLKLRSFQHLFKDFGIHNGSDLLEQFQRSFSEHLISWESNIRAAFEKDKVEDYRRLREEKDTKIEELASTKQRMSKQIQMLTRRLQKLDRQTSKHKINSCQMLQEGQNSYKTKEQQLQSKIQQYELEINNLAKELDASKQNEKVLQKSVKDFKYLKEEAERRFIDENIKVKSTKEEFLLNQIAILKKQFKNDIQQLTQLYSTKEHDYKITIEELKTRNAQLIRQISCEKEVQTKILGDAVSSRDQVERFKKQNQCLVTDLHRMNQELYQHWLALKDIKTLAVRLQIFTKFAKIYEDVGFNDQLFI